MNRNRRTNGNRPLRTLLGSLLGTLFLLTGCAETGAWLQSGSDQAVKQLLDMSSSRAVNTLSANGGFSQSAYKLLLPDSVQSVASGLRAVGLGSYVDKVETAMNRGAEQAAAEAAPLFKQAVADITVRDALAIISGGEQSATDYFRRETESALRSRFQPIVASNLQKTGFYDQYKALMDAYNRLPLANKPALDLESGIVKQSLDAVYAQMAKEERAIRQDPVGSGSALIGAVFGAKQ